MRRSWPPNRSRVRTGRNAHPEVSPLLLAHTPVNQASSVRSHTDPRHWSCAGEQHGKFSVCGCPERISGTDLLGHASSRLTIETTWSIDRGELIEFACRTCLELQRSVRRSADSKSRWELTDTNSPTASHRAAARAANPAVRIAPRGSARRSAPANGRSGGGPPRTSGCA